MNNLTNWLKRRGIPYRHIEPWALAFSGNHPNGVLISIDYHDEIIRYKRRNRGFDYELRGNYTSIYLYPREEEVQSCI